VSPDSSGSCLEVPGLEEFETAWELHKDATGKPFTSSNVVKGAFDRGASGGMRAPEKRVLPPGPLARRLAASLSTAMIYTSARNGQGLP
jgi:hypothetical protein